MAKKQTQSTIPKEALANSITMPTKFAGQLPALVILLLGFLLYANTFSHEYALDDAIVITENDYTQKGVGGISDLMTNDAFTGYFKAKKNLVAGGRYRPLSMITFAIEISIFGNNAPEISHIINALLYALTCWLVYRLLMNLLQPMAKSQWWATLPFLAALLFTVHPLHTEVVANIKGRDEILALLLSLWAFQLFLKGYDKRNILLGIAAGVVLFFAILAKESAVPFILLLPLSIWFFREMDWKHIALQTLPLLAALGIYLMLRAQFAPPGDPGAAPKEILNDPFLNATYSQQLATVMVTFGKYLQLLVAPVNLSHDYYFNQIPVANWGEMRVIIPLLLTLGMGAAAIWGLIKKNLLGFGLTFYFATLFLVSNIIFPIGTTMGERFVFIPSLGFILALLWMLERVSIKWLQMPKGMLGKPIVYACMLVALLYGGKTITRNPVWENNDTLFLSDVETCPRSAKLQTAAGGTLVERARKEMGPKKESSLLEAINHLDAAIKIYPDHGAAHLLRGNALFELGRFPEAVESFSKAVFHRPKLPNGMQNLAVARSKAKDFKGSAQTWLVMAAQTPDSASNYYIEAGNAYSEIPMPDSAFYFYQKSSELAPNNSIAYAKMGMIAARYMQDYPRGIDLFQTALAKGDNDPGTWENLGITHAMSGNPQQAINTFQEGIKKHPNAANLYFNLAVTYQNLGDTIQSAQAMQKARQLDPVKFK